MRRATHARACAGAAGGRVLAQPPSVRDIGETHPRLRDMAIDYQAVLDSIVDELQPRLSEGRVATYIPALARVPQERLGIALCAADGREAMAGAGDEPFSIQSISKVFTLALAMQHVGEWLWERIGREPSGDPFNSLVQLEHEHGIPRNPLINAGAIAVADRLVSGCGDAKREILQMMSALCGDEVGFDREVAASEAATGYRNMALANLMRSFGKLDNAVATVLDVYFHQCSIAMTCQQLARASRFLMHDGMHGGAPVLDARQTRRVNALMLTCGTYDSAGEFAFKIGLPCKSGVGGGIIAVLPGEFSLCVWSPGLERTGNSLVGMLALESFVEKTGLSLF
jgi:glutaminase